MQLKDFKTALKAFSNVVPKKASHPVLENIFCEVHETFTQFSVTNLAETLLYKFEGNFGENGKYLVSLTQLKNKIDALETKTLDLKFSKKDLQINDLISLSYFEDLQGFPSTLLTAKAETFGTFPNNFSEALKDVQRYIQKQDSPHPAITSVCLREVDKQIALVGTDGHKLKAKFLDFNTSLQKDCLIPPSSLKVLNGLELAGTSFSLYDLKESKINYDYLTVFGKTWQFQCKLSGQQFPLYQSIIPARAKANTVLEIDREQFQSFLKVLSTESKFGKLSVKSRALYLGTKEKPAMFLLGSNVEDSRNWCKGINIENFLTFCKNSPDRIELEIHPRLFVSRDSDSLFLSSEIYFRD